MGAYVVAFLPDLMNQRRELGIGEELSGKIEGGVRFMGGQFLENGRTALGKGAAGELEGNFLFIGGTPNDAAVGVFEVRRQRGSGHGDGNESSE